MSELLLRTGHRLRDRFEITGELGRGGMGVVFAALDLERGTSVAIKLLRGRGGVSQLKREFRTLADLRHPNLVRLDALFADAEPCFFTMERIDGVDLLRWVRPEDEPPPTDASQRTLVDPAVARASTRPRTHESEPGTDAPPLDQPLGSTCDEGRLRYALAQIVDALCALHAAGHVHRDLKPSNVLVTPEGRAVLIDFGISRPRVDASAAVVEGTPAYMAPEQWTAERVGPAADWYALGVIMFEALTGTLPFDGSLREIVAQKSLLQPSVPLDGVAPDLARLALGLLAPDPDARPGPDEIRAVLAASTRPTSLYLAERLRAPPSHFVGRDAELARMWEALEQSRRAPPTILRVLGESGVGKSALVDRFLDAAEHAEPTLVALRGRCYQNELVPYKAWDGVIDSLARHLVRLEERSPGALAAILPADRYPLTRLFPVLGAVAASVPEAGGRDSSFPMGPERLRQRAFDDLRELLAGLRRLGQLVLAIDDWQWADGDSEQLLDALARHPDSPPFLLLVTERPQQEGPRGLADRATTLTLGPLDREQSVRLAEALSAGDQPREALEAVARNSGGHPMFLQQLLHRVDAHGSARLDELIHDRARALAPDAQRVLELVCLAGTPLSRVVIEAAAALPRARCNAILEELEGEKLVRGAGSRGELEPWHDRIREVVEASPSHEARIALHASLAAALSTHGGESHALHRVQHLRAAGLLAQAAEAAEAGARRAREGLAFERAAELFRLALELGAHPPEHEIALRVDLADALSSAGIGAREAVRGFLAGADASADADRALDLRTRALDQLAISGHVHEALELVRQIYAALGAPLPRGRLGLVAGVVLHRARLRLRRWPRLDELEATDATAPAPESLASRLYTTTINSITILEPLLVQYIHARTLVGAIATRDRTTLGLCLSRESGLSVVFGADRLEHAERASQMAHRLFRDDPSASHRGWLHVGDAIRLHFTGRFRKALEHWRAAERIFTDAPRPPFALLSGITIFVLACHRYLGQIAQLRAALERARRDAVSRGDLYLDVTSTLSSGIGALLTEGAGAALADLERVEPSTELATWGPNVWYDARARAEADLHRDAPVDTLRAHAQAMRGLARTPSGLVATWRAEMPWLEARLWLACAARGERSGLRRARRIARRLLAGGLPYEQIWGGLLAGALHHLAGDDVGACAALERCAELAGLHGYALCEAAARARLAERSGQRALASPASAYFAAESIGDVDAALRVTAPGFASRPALRALRVPALPAELE